MMPIQRLFKAIRGNRGSAAIEFAIISPVFVILLVGVVELGFAAFDAMRVEDAAETGALYAAVHGWNSAGITTAVTSATGAVGLTATPAPVLFCGCPGSAGITATTCSSTCPSGGTASQYITVSASMPRVVIMTQTISSLPVTLTAHSTIRVQ